MKPHHIVGLCLFATFFFCLGVFLERSKKDTTPKQPPASSEDWLVQHQLGLAKNQDLAKRYRETLEAYTAELQARPVNRSEREKLRAVWGRRQLAYDEWWEKAEAALLDAMKARAKAEREWGQLQLDILAKQAEAMESVNFALWLLARRHQVIGRRDCP